MRLHARDKDHEEGGGGKGRYVEEIQEEGRQGKPLHVQHLAAVDRNWAKSFALVELDPRLHKHLDEDCQELKEPIDLERPVSKLGRIYTSADKVVDWLSRGQCMPDKLGA